MSKNVLMMSHGITGVTGFSNQLKLQADALSESKDEDYNIYVIHRDYRGEPIVFPKDSNVYTAGGRHLKSMTILPVGGEQWGTDVMPYYIERYNIDYVHTLGDIWCYQYIKQIQRHHHWKWIAHYVFDTENMVGFWHDCVKNADVAVVPSKNSLAMLEHFEHKNVKYIPHGIDINTYKPATSEEKLQFRKDIGLPENAFVVGCVAHNQYRKMVNRLLRAFKLFYMKNPDALLLLHMSPKDATGWDLGQMIKDWGLGRAVLFTDKNSKGFGDVHVPESEMRKLYCSMDVHALPTGGEGFGVPIVEAMACGLPNIVTDYTTTKEFLCEADPSNPNKYVNERGFAVPYNEIEEHHTGGIWAKVNIPLMAEAMQRVKDAPGEARAMGLRARKFAAENYDGELVKEQWRQFYRKVDEFAYERFKERSLPVGLKAIQL